MSREVQIVLWCDGVHKRRTPGVQEFTVSINGGPARMFAVCEACRETVNRVAEMMESGSEPEQQVSGDEMDRVARNQCPICEYQGGTRRALSQHIRKHHGTSIKAYR